MTDEEANWRNEASCKEMETDIFFTPETVFQARTICRECPVRTPCLEFALLNNIQEGIYGGHTEEERRRMRRRMRGGYATRADKVDAYLTANGFK